MKTTSRNMAFPVLLCWLTAQVTWLALESRLWIGSIVFDPVFLVISAIPIVVFSVAMTYITRRLCRQNGFCYKHYLWSVGLILLGFFALLPFFFFGVVYPPASWLHRVPSTAEWTLLGNSVVAGLAGTAILHAFWKRTNRAQQAPEADAAQV